jgi:hypothetical protein
MFTLQTTFRPLLLKRGGGSVSREDCEQQGGKLLRLWFFLRPRIRPQYNMSTEAQRMYSTVFLTCLFWGKQLKSQLVTATKIFSVKKTRRNLKMREINIKTICRKGGGGLVKTHLVGTILACWERSNHGGTRIKKKTSLFSVVGIGCSPSPHPNANTARMATSFPLKLWGKLYLQLRQVVTCVLFPIILYKMSLKKKITMMECQPLHSLDL